MDIGAFQILKARLMIEERYERYPYKDTRGILTVGYGRNLESVGLSEKEASFLLDNDIRSVERSLLNMPVFLQLDSMRKSILLDMAFNLGAKGLFGFKKMFEALAKKDYEQAAREMQNSTWSKQVGGRADKLIDMMRAGQ